VPDNQPTYAQGYDYVSEPNALMTYNGSGGLGAMTSKEAYQRVVTSLPFLIWEFELKHGSSR
jgi:hypothetical protein